MRAAHVVGWAQGEAPAPSSLTKTSPKGVVKYADRHTSHFPMYADRHTILIPGYADRHTIFFPWYAGRHTFFFLRLVYVFRFIVFL